MQARNTSSDRSDHSLAAVKNRSAKNFDGSRNVSDILLNLGLLLDGILFVSSLLEQRRFLGQGCGRIWGIRGNQLLQKFANRDPSKA